MVLCGIRIIPDFHKRILFSDEAHFWLNGYVNKHNCRIWSEANPQVYVETPLHPEKLTVWCALWAGGIIGPYFFKNDEGQIGLHPSQPIAFVNDCVRTCQPDGIFGEVEGFRITNVELETAKPTEEAEFEEDLNKCEIRLDDLEVRVKKID
ncbi:uncharacterized protein TNCV_988941 [Trichonephila clavipes]|nr:uncharacterized protein TNCV_988941 [Trichonephila clavipes]